MTRFILLNNFRPFTTTKISPNNIQIFQSGFKNFGMLNIAVKKLPKYFGNSQSDFLPRSGHTGNECTAKSCSDPDTQILSLRNSNVGRYRVDRYTVSASLSQVIFLSLYSWFLPFISNVILPPSVCFRRFTR